MAIVSISRIQIRRGRKNQGSGLPQLAGGELGWAVDTQELYIGNGAVSEGAPAVGNSKVLTEHDNLFELSDQYTYKNGTSIQTGSSSANPVQRSLQSRLDDLVNVRSFGANGDGTDQTLALQRAIDQLFLPWSSATDADSLRKRITLKLDAGLYKISNSLKVPPYVNLGGDGSDKPVIEQTGAYAVIETINGNGINAQTSSTNQSNIIKLEGMTLKSYLTNPALKLSSTKDSQFIDIKLQGPWTQGSAITSTQIGLLMEATSTPVTTQNNNFEKLKVVGFSYGILSNHDVTNNHFEDCVFETLSYGVYWGRDTSLGQVAQATGPINNTITNSRFTNIDKTGYWVKEGKGNVSKENSFIKVGNDGGLDSAPVHAVIRFDSDSNISKNDFFARTELLMANTSTMTNVAYIPEVQGKFNNELSFVTKFNVGQLASATRVAKLPADNSKHYKVEYTYNSSIRNAFRSGTLDINIDRTVDTVNMSDEYDFLGDTANNTNSTRLNFTASLSDENSDGAKETLILQATNPSLSSNENAQIIFKVRSIS